MDHRVYWIWLQQAFGPGSRLPCELGRRFVGGVEEFYQGGPKLWNAMAFITDQQAATLFSFSLGEAEAQLEHAEKVGWWVVTPECEKYPEPLRNISDPPAVLYGKGELPDWQSRPAIAIVGALKALDVSVEAARKIGCQLACGGAPVISGGALGIDTAALTGAMSVLGPVVSVLPVDLGSPYLNKNMALRRDILEKGGALVCEYFMQRQPSLGGFQVRNRLITGLGCGVVLIQAAAKSGTMIYAKHALDQNRDVFVYPGPAGAPEYAGSQGLLRDGAKAVTCGEDVLEEYSTRFAIAPSDIFQAGSEYDGLFDDIPLPVPEVAMGDPGLEGDGLSPEEERVLGAFAGETLTVPQLGERTGLGPGALLSLLTGLELDGRVESVAGRRYRVC